MTRQRVLAQPDAAVVIALKANPGGWWAIADGDQSRRHVLNQVAYRIRQGKQAAFRCEAGSFEARVHCIGDTVELWARYVPSESVESDRLPI